MDINNCQCGEKAWQCPDKNCQKVLTRNQTLLVHIKTFHQELYSSLNIDTPRKYKRYEVDSSIPIPKSTHYWKKARLCDDSDETKSKESHDRSSAASIPSTSTIQSDKSKVETEHAFENHGLRLLPLESLPNENFHDESSDMSISTADDFRSDLSTTDSYCEEEDDSPSQTLTTETINEVTDPPVYVIPAQTQRYSSSITRSEHILAVSSLASRFNLSSKAIEAVLELTQIHLPDDNIAETSVEHLKDQCGFGKDYISYHLYCESCKKLFSDEDVCKTADCRGSKSNPDCKKYFVTSKLETQLKEVFERPGIWESILQSYASNTDGVVCDIKNGEGYRKLQEPGGFLYNTTNITMSLFTDGIPLYKSSSVSLWPVYLLINELPPKERFQRKNMILWGVWQGVGKPQMCMFLRPLVNDLIQLHQQGFLFNAQGKMLRSKAMLIVATMDLQARAYVLNMTQHNGLCGCLYCLEPGVVVPSGKGRCRSYPFNPTPSLRNAECARNSAVQARQSGNRVDGFFGESVLMYLPYFDVTTNVTIDYMHGILLGICKKLMDLWFDHQHAKGIWYIGTETKVVDKLLLDIKPPYFIHRRPRIVTKTYHHWKASEFRNWLLFYSLPCLKGKLPDIYLKHYSCLVEATYLLLTEGISKDDLCRAELLLNTFCSNMSDLYYPNVMSMNVHNLTHLVKFVKLWGPLWCWSCFAFESFNGEIKKAIHGTGNVCKEVFWALQSQKRVERKMEDLRMEGKTDSKAYSFMEKMTMKRESASGLSAYKCSVVKVTDLKTNFTKEAGDFLKENYNSDNIRDYCSVAKVLRNGFTMYSKTCTKVKKQNSYTILMDTYIEGADVIEVEAFVMHKTLKKVLAIGKLMTRNECVIPRRSPHLRRLCYKSADDSLAVVRTETLREPLLIIGKGDTRYGGVLPNQHERD